MLVLLFAQRFQRSNPRERLSKAAFFVYASIIVSIAGHAPSSVSRSLRSPEEVAQGKQCVNV